MNKAFLNLKTQIANWRHWELNPIVVKELRQAVRSWTVTGTLLLLLAVLFCTSIVFLVGNSFNVDRNARLGADIFQSFVVILAGASLLFIPLYVGIRLAIERQDSNLDLLYTSTLTPGGIIRGKFFCGAYTALLFFSACMPFMTFTNLLRGVDLPSMFIILAYLFVVVCAAIQVAIFLACLPVSKAFKVLLGLGGVIIALFVAIPMALLANRLMYSGVGAMIGSSGFWEGLLTFAALALAGLLLLYFLSVAMISPLSANRALPLRIYITVIWLIGGIVSACWMYQLNEAWPILPWALATMILMALALVIVVSGEDQLSLRVRREIPEGRLRRSLAFVYFNGVAGGLLWVALLLGVTCAVTNGLMLSELFPSSRAISLKDENEFLSKSPSILAYTFAYALTALFIHRTFLRRRAPKLAGVLMVLIGSAAALIPGFVLFLMNDLSWRSLNKFQPGNVFNVFGVKDGWELWSHLIISIVWLLIGVGLNARWFVAQWKSFRPLERRTQSAVEPTMPPPLPT